MDRIIPFRKAEKRDSFSETLRPHLPALYRMAYRLTRNRADSEDLLQDLVVKLYGRREQLSELDEPVVWLRRTLYNQYVDSYRRARLRPTPFTDLTRNGDEDPLAARPSPDAGPEALAERTQNNELLSRAIDALSENQRALVLLHDVEGMTLTELEKILDEPLGTLKSRLHRARRALRDLLRDATF